MTDLRITVRNTSEAGGTFLTPVYFGFHNGDFDLFNVGEEASPGLEVLAEDGSAALLGQERAAAAADSQGLVVTGAGGPVAAQEVTFGTLDVDGTINTDVSLAAMILPSNDAFIGTDEAVTLFDDQGSFLGAQTLVFEGTNVYDAGTEVNTEIEAAFLNQTGPNSGVTEGGTVQLHQGFHGSEGSPVNILSGTAVNAAGAAIDPTAADFTRNGGQEDMLGIEVTAVELADGTYDVSVTVTNNSPVGGTFLTPVWFGFQDGSFDLYDRGAAVSAGLESLAEDGATATIDAEFAAIVGTGGVSSTTSTGPIAPGSSTTQTVNVDPALVGPGYFTWATMVIPSNDAFLASPGNPQSDPIFDAQGNFLGSDENPIVITRIGSDVLDAGTEVNNEIEAAFLNQTGPDTGIDQGGVVTVHQGFNGSEGSPVNILSGTAVNAAGASIDPVAADFTRPGAQIAEVHINTVVTTTGTTGRDFFIGAADDDIVTGDAGRDILFGRAGFDDLDGGADRDIIFGGLGDDIVNAGTGNDLVFGGEGRDTINGDAGRDRLDGDAGDDLINGGADRDKIRGEAGDDVLLGDSGRDFLFGGIGADVLNGGTGNDRLFGGSQSDTFVFAAGNGRDRVDDFNASEDIIAFTSDLFTDAAEALASARTAGGSVRIDYADNDFVILRNTNLSDLTEDNFTFV